MKIRCGFVTNSSSTNFLIISKEKLTKEYLIEKLGFKNNSQIIISADSLAEDILYGIDSYHNIEDEDEKIICELFGEESAQKYLTLSKKGFHVYWGHTNSDDNPLTEFMTTDNFVIDEKDFYMNGLSCTW